MYFFFQFPYFTLISGEEPYHGCTDIKPLLLLLLLIFVRARFHFALIGGNLRAPSTGSHKGIGGGIQIPET